MAHWLDCWILGGRIARRLDAASLLHCNPKCILIPNPIGSPTFPSLKLESRRSRLPRGPFQGSKIASRMLVELQKGAAVLDDANISIVPPKSWARGWLSVCHWKPQPPNRQGLLRDVGSPKGQVHHGKDEKHGLWSFESTNMRQATWRPAVASKLAGS